MSARVIGMAEWKARRERAEMRRLHSGPSQLPPRHTLDDIMRNGPWWPKGGAA